MWGVLALIAFTVGWAPALFSPLTWQGGNPMLPAAPSGATGASAGQLTNPSGVLGHIPHGILTRLHFGFYFLTTALPESLGARLVYPPHAGDLWVIALDVIAGLVVAGGAVMVFRAIGWPRSLASLIADRARWNLLLLVVVAAVILGGYLARKLLSPGTLFVDEARYLLPLTVPVTLALAYTYTAIARRAEWGSRTQALTRRLWPRAQTGTVVASALLLLTLATYGGQWLASDPVQAFSSLFNLSSPLPGGAFPAEDTALLTYLESHHIHYAWVNHWQGDVVMYLTNQRTLCSDYVDVTYYHGIDRFPQATTAVEQADRASFIVAWGRTTPPPLASALDALGVRYTSARFGRFWVFTPITRTVYPQEVGAALKSAYW